MSEWSIEHAWKSIRAARSNAHQNPSTQFVSITSRFAAGRARPRDDHLAYELRLHQHDFLRDHPAHREPEEVHPFETHGLDERDCVLGHLLYRSRRCAAGRANASIVERDHVMLRRETINNPRVPVV